MTMRSVEIEQYSITDFIINESDFLSYKKLIEEIRYDLPFTKRLISVILGDEYTLKQMEEDKAYKYKFFDYAFRRGKSIYVLSSFEFGTLERIPRMVEELGGIEEFIGYLMI